LGQTIWIASFSESTTFGTLVSTLGISGPVWYAFAGIMPTMLFMVPLVRYRMIAPGSRTFLHVIYGRFGRTAHLMFCTFALLNNLYIVATIIESMLLLHLPLHAWFQRLFTSISTEITFDLVWIVAITIAGICVNCAKLRQVFPVCLVGSGLLMLSSMAFFVGVYFLSNNPKLGSITKVYEANVMVNDLYSGEVNRMSFRNWYTWILAGRKFLNSLAPRFMDQATWDTCCHAVPGEESIGVFVASVLWMTLPYAFATACSNAFIALSPHKTLIDRYGIATSPQTSVAVGKALFGRGGLLVLFIMYAFIIANISVFQLFSISSILTFDIYAIHLRTYCASMIVGINVLVAATLGSLLYAFFWERMTSAGVVVGTALSTSIAGFVWVLMSTLVKFHPNFSIDAEILDIALFLISIMGGFIFPSLVVCIERRRKGFNEEETTNLQCQSWRRIYEIDNPLSPWALEYAVSFKFNNFNMESYDRPDPEEVRRVYRRSWHFALCAAISFLTLSVVIMPFVFYVFSFMDVVSFKIWICLVLVALVTSAAVAIFMPIVWEGIQLYRLRRAQLQSQIKQHEIPQIEFINEIQDDDTHSSFS
uniref:Urea transporter n=1 Tax=Taenia asiatica TaxID=60517 RepID=A0A158R6I2_TAEAS